MSCYYSSYVEDPKWQGTFTIIWCSALAIAVAVSLPSLIISLRQGRFFKGITGISEITGYRPVPSDNNKPLPPPRSRSSRRLVGAWNALISTTYWSPPKLELNLGQGANRRRHVTTSDRLTNCMVFSHSLVGVPCSCTGLCHKGCPSHLKPQSSW